MRAFRCNRTRLIIVDPYCSSLSAIDGYDMSLRFPASDVHHDAAVFFLAPAGIGFIIMSDPVLTGKYKEVHWFMYIYRSCSGLFIVKHNNRPTGGIMSPALRSG